MKKTHKTTNKNKSVIEKPIKPIANKNEEVKTIVPLETEEILFWKVWRNVYTKSIIIKFISKRSTDGFLNNNIYKYNELVSVCWLLENGYYEVLRYKVINGESLYFKIPNFDNTIKNYNSMVLFNHFQDDVQFYECLFKNYSINFVEKNSISGSLDLGFQSLSYSLKYDNVVSLTILVNKYGLKVDTDTFIDTVDRGSFKIAEYLYKTLKFNRNDIISNVWKSSTFLYTKLSNKKSVEINFKTTKLLLVDLKIIPPIAWTNIDNGFNYLYIKNLTIKQLYQLCWTIALLLEKTCFFNDYLKSLSKLESTDFIMDNIMDDFNDDDNNESSEFKPVPSTDFLNRKQLDQIKLELDDLLNGMDCCDRTIVGLAPKEINQVFKLFKMAIPFTDKTGNYYAENLSFFKCKYYNDFSIVNSIKEIEALEFCSFKELSLVKDYLIYDESSQLVADIFKYNDNLESQHEFVNQFFQTVISLDPQSRDSKILNLLKLLLKVDKLDIIKQTFNQILEYNNNGKNGNGKIINLCEIIPINLMDSICSIKTFDYLYSIYETILLSQDKSTNLWKEFGVEKCLNSKMKGLMLHIKTNRKQFYSDLLNSMKNESTTKYSYSKDSLLFIYNNMDDFINIYEKINVWDRNKDYGVTELNEFIQLVNGTPSNQNYSINFTNQINYTRDKSLRLKTNKMLSRYHWLKNNKSNDLESNRILGIDVGIPYVYEYYRGNFQNIIDNFKIGKSNDFNYFNYFTYSGYFTDNIQRDNVHILRQVVKEIGVKGDIESFSLFMKFLNIEMEIKIVESNYNLHHFLGIILLNAVSKCQINFIKYVQLNHPWIFKDSKNGSNFYNYKVLDRIYPLSVKKGYYEIASLLNENFYN